MRLVIFTEAGKQKGMGHYVRMLSIYKACNDHEYETKMYIDTDGEIDDLLLQNGVILNQWTNRNEALDLLDKNTILIVDSYHVSMEFLNQCRERVRNLLVIDDNYRLPYRNMKILNPNYFGGSLPYSLNEGNIYYIGKDYTLLRSEFYANTHVKCRQIVRDVLITFGGTDVLNMTDKVIRYMKEEHSNINLHVIVTSAYSNIETVKRLLSANDELIINASAAEICDLMCSVDFAIASAGGTSNELVRIQCPSILLVVADNQTLSAKYLETQGLVRLFDEINLEQIDTMLSFDVRNSMKKCLKTQESNLSAVDMIVDLLKG